MSKVSNPMCWPTLKESWNILPKPTWLVEILLNDEAVPEA